MLLSCRTVKTIFRRMNISTRLIISLVSAGAIGGCASAPTVQVPDTEAADTPATDMAADKSAADRSAAGTVPEKLME